MSEPLLKQLRDKRLQINRALAASCEYFVKYLDLLATKELKDLARDKKAGWQNQAIAVPDYMEEQMRELPASIGEDLAGSQIPANRHAELCIIQTANLLLSLLQSKQLPQSDPNQAEMIAILHKGLWEPQRNIPAEAKQRLGIPNQGTIILAPNDRSLRLDVTRSFQQLTLISIYNYLAEHCQTLERFKAAHFLDMFWNYPELEDFSHAWLSQQVQNLSSPNHYDPAKIHTLWKLSGFRAAGRIGKLAYYQLRDAIDGARQFINNGHPLDRYQFIQWMTISAKLIGAIGFLCSAPFLALGFMAYQLTNLPISLLFQHKPKSEKFLIRLKNIYLYAMAASTAVSLTSQFGMPLLTQLGMLALGAVTGSVVLAAGLLLAQVAMTQLAYYLDDDEEQLDNDDNDAPNAAIDEHERLLLAANPGYRAAYDRHRAAQHNPMDDDSVDDEIRAVFYGHRQGPW